MKVQFQWMVKITKESKAERDKKDSGRKRSLSPTTPVSLCRVKNHHDHDSDNYSCFYYLFNEVLYTILAFSFLDVLTTISFTGFFKKKINGAGFGGKVITSEGGDVASEE